MSSVPTEVHDLILERDGGRCVACARTVSGERGTDYSIHHRMPAQSGGSDHPYVTSLSNFVTLCGGGAGTQGCHGRVEKERRVAEQYGLLIRRGGLFDPDREHDPARLPVWIADRPDEEDLLTWGDEWPAAGRRWYLDNEGGKSLDEPGADPRPEEPPAPVDRKGLPAHYGTLSPAEIHQFRTVYPDALRRAAEVSDRVASVDELTAAETAAAMGGAA